jgi:hypothetical protein
MDNATKGVQQEWTLKVLDPQYLKHKQEYEDKMAKKKITVEFAPGCFDNFDGTQEELDQLIAEITRMAESGEMLEKSRPLDFDEMIEEDPEIAQKVIEAIVQEGTRKLQ